MTEPTNAVVSAFRDVPREAAAGYIDRYFGLGAHAGEEFTGAHFERFTPTPADEITADDLIAVSCLSVHVPAKAALGILGSKRGEISDLLAQIPADLPLADLSLDRHAEILAPDSPASRLWHVLRSRDAKRWGVGPTTASKIMARKRPALIPIYDSVVGAATGFRSGDGTWQAWHEAFATDGEFVAELEDLRAAADLRDISLLRILDVVLWMHGTRGGTSARETVDVEGDL